MQFVQGKKALAGIQWSKARFTFPATSRLELLARDGADLLLSAQLELITDGNIKYFIVIYPWFSLHWD